MLEFKTDLKKYIPFQFPYNVASNPLVSFTVEEGEKVQYSVEPKVGVRRKILGSFKSEVVLFRGAITAIRVGVKEKDLFIYSDSPAKGVSNVTLIRDKEVVKVFSIADVGRESVWLVPYEGVMYLFYEQHGGLYYLSEESDFQEPVKVFDLINKSIHFLGLLEDGSVGFMPKIAENSLLGVDTNFRQVFLPPAHFNFTLRGDKP